MTGVQTCALPIYGTRIAFASERDGAGDIYVMNANGSNLRRLTNSEDKEGTSLEWSPDGTRIAYVAIKPDGNWEVRIIGLEVGAQPQDFAHRTADEWQPRWSPDGRSIAYTSYRSGAPDIMISNIYAGTLEQPTKGVGQNYLPVFSPDGTRLAFVSNRDGNNEIYVMNRDGSNLTRLTNNPAIDVTPTWSPAGTQIAFTSERSGSPQIYVINEIGRAHV